VSLRVGHAAIPRTRRDDNGQVLPIRQKDAAEDGPEGQALPLRPLPQAESEAGNDAGTVVLPQMPANLMHNIGDAMPRQNRVTPFGDIVATPDRGAFMGNRGVLHDDADDIRRPWQVKRWIVCVLEFRGRHRTMMTPNRYTELFFLDEATALAAGHRPCAECRHARFLDFCAAWATANANKNKSRRATADEIDRRLHAERLNSDRSKRTYSTKLSELPDGVFIRDLALKERTYLVRGRELLEWSPGGYVDRIARPKWATVEVLTPASTVAAIRAGYVPEVHSSADVR
jgi:hypothetical protein